jgi:hypothetical protein
VELPLIIGSEIRIENGPTRGNVFVVELPR